MFNKNINLFRLWIVLGAKEATLSKVTSGSGLVFFLGALLCFGGTALMFSQGEGKASEIIIHSLTSLKWVWVLTILALGSFLLLRKKSRLGVIFTKVLWAYVSIGLGVAAIVSGIQLYELINNPIDSAGFVAFTRILAIAAFGFFSVFGTRGFRYVSRIRNDQLK